MINCWHYSLVVDCLIQDSCPDGGDDLRYEGIFMKYLVNEINRSLMNPT